MEYTQLFGMAILLILTTVTLFKVFKSNQDSGDEKDKLQELEIKLATMIDKSQYDQLQGKFIELENTKKHLEEQLEKSNAHNLSLNDQLKSQIAKISTLETDIKNLHAVHAEYKQEVQLVQTMFKNEFEVLANKIYDQKVDAFQKSSSKSLEQMLNPLEKQISDFKKKVEDTYDTNNKERISLKQEIKHMNELNLGLKQEAFYLTQALKGDAKKQGDWGEVQLELILERSGLQKEYEYIIQGKGMGLKDESGNTQKPDVIVNFPGDKHLIIDSKVSLNNYYQYIEASDEKEKEQQIEKLLSAVKNHVDGLSGKKYEYNEKLNSPEYVLLFFPLEGALSLVADKKVSGHNLSLTQYAWDRNIAIVTPTTLFTSMKTISNLWQFEKQKKNVLRIAEESGKMYDKFVTLTQKLEGIKKRFDSTSKDFDDTLGYLNTGRGHIVGQMKKIKDLGAKAKKQIDSEKWGSEDVELTSIDGDKKEVS